MRAKKKRDYLGLTLLVSAFVLTIVFIVTCIKKKNVLAALAAVAAVNAVGGWWVLRCNRHGGYFFDFFDENNYEVFDEDEAEHARHAVRAGLHKKHDISECGVTSQPVYEIPVDDETTEEDFAK